MCRIHPLTACPHVSAVGGNPAAHDLTALSADEFAIESLSGSAFISIFPKVKVFPELCFTVHKVVLKAPVRQDLDLLNLFSKRIGIKGIHAQNPGCDPFKSVLTKIAVVTACFAIATSATVPGRMCLWM